MSTRGLLIAGAVLRFTHMAGGFAVAFGYTF
jgi:hypothetical protein